MARKPHFGRIYKRKGRDPYWIEFYSNGRQIRESAKSERYAAAEALLKKRHAEIETGSYAGPEAARVKVGELLDGVLLDYQTNGKDAEWAERKLANLRPHFGAMKAARLQTRDIQTFIVARRTEGMTNATINRELALLHRAFTLAARQTPPRVVRVPVFPPKLKEAAPRKGFFEYGEFVTFRAELPEHLRPLVTFAYYSGCRKGEILALLWSQVDLVARVVRLEPGETKNDEARTIPLPGDLFEMLALEKAKRDTRFPACEFVFARYGKRIKSIRGAWDEAAKRAGLWNADRERPTRIFHDLRRTGARNLVRAGVPERVVMAIGGWKTRSVFDRYNIVSERDLHDAASKLERHMAELADGHAESTGDKDHLRTMTGKTQPRPS